MDYINISIILLYFSVCFLLGLYNAFKIKNIRDFTLGKKDFATSVVVATIFATDIGPAATLGAAGKVYSFGLFFIFIRFLRVIGYVVIYKIFAPNVDKFKNCISIGDIFKQIFGKKSANIINWIVVLHSIGTLSLQVTAISIIFHFFGLNYNLAVILAFSMLTIYSTLGGIKAVAFTDLFQFCIFFIAIPVACSIAYNDMGGYKSIINYLEKANINLDFNIYNNKLEAISLILMSFIPPLCPPSIHRLLIARNTNQLKIALKIIILIYIPFTLFICLVGILMKISGNVENSDYTLLYLLQIYVPPGLLGLMIAGILSVVMSTADSFMNTTSVTIAHNIIKPYVPNISTKNELLLARLSTIILGCIAIPIALLKIKIMDLIWAVDTLYFPIVLFPLIYGFLGYKSKYKFFILHTFFAVIFTLIGCFIQGKFGSISIISGMLGSALTFIIFKFRSSYIIQLLFYLYKNNLSILLHYNKYKKILLNFFSLSCNYDLLSISYILFNLFFILSFITNVFINPLSNHSIFLYFEAFICIFCIVMIFYQNQNYINKLLKTIILYHLIFALPFYSFLVLLTHNEGFTIIYNLLSIAIYYALLKNFNKFFISIVYSFIFALLLKLTIPNPYFYNDTYQPYFIYSFYSLILLVIVIYINEKNTENQLSSTKTFASAIAHESISPISSTLMGYGIIKNLLKEKDFNSAIELFEKQENILKKGLGNIDILLQYATDQIKDYKDWGKYSIFSSIDKAVTHFKICYPYYKNISLINSSKKDNLYYGSENLLILVIFNLLKNAFTHSTKKISVNITLSNNKIYIKDNGNGMNENILENIFQRHSTTGGYGVGLVFCKRAMNKMNGDIQCNSISGEYTEFILNLNIL